MSVVKWLPRYCIVDFWFQRMYSGVVTSVRCIEMARQPEHMHPVSTTCEVGGITAKVQQKCSNLILTVLNLIPIQDSLARNVAGISLRSV